jgi:hypothetical protein
MPAIGGSARRATLSVFAALLVLGGCDRGAEEAESPGAQRRAAQTKPEAQKDPLADMVSAVSASKTSAPVELKFALHERPQVGKPIVVEVAVLPVSDLDRVAANFQAGAGLELRSGAQMAVVTKPATGVALSHRLTIVPQRDGIFFVSATVLADSPEQSIARTFSIPIIAGQASPSPEAAASPPPKPQKR